MSGGGGISGRFAGRGSDHGRSVRRKCAKVDRSRGATDVWLAGSPLTPAKTSMIVDCHTHIWQSPEQLGQLDLGNLPRHGRGRTGNLVSARLISGKSAWRSLPAADPDHHWAQSNAVDKSIVL